MKRRRWFTALSTYGLVALSAFTLMGCIGTGPPLSIAVSAAAGIPGAYSVLRRFERDPLEWLGKEEPEGAEKLETAREVSQLSGPVVDRLKAEADDLSGSIQFSRFKPPLPWKRLMAVAALSVLLGALPHAPVKLEDGFGTPLQGGAGDGWDSAQDKGGPGGETNSADQEGRGAGSGEGEMDLGEPTDVYVGDERVRVRVYRSYGSEVGTPAEVGGDFAESGDFPPVAERSGSFSDSLPKRHKEAVIRYFRSMVE